MQVASTYEDPRAHAVRERYLDTFGGEGLPVPVEGIAADLLGLHVEERWDIECSGMLLPAERRIVLNAAEDVDSDGQPIRRRRFTLAHEIGHWICHCDEGRAPVQAASYCRAVDVSDAADRTLEREANVFAAELLMPERTVRDVWSSVRDIDYCAARFDVSPTAMRWRLFSFQLLQESGW